MGNVLLNKRFLSLISFLLPLLLSFSLVLYKHRIQTDSTQSQRETAPDMAATVKTSTISTPTPISTTATTTEMIIAGVKIERNPSESKLTELGVSSWPKWGCSPSKFPWTFTAKETMYLLEGKVAVYCDGYDGSFEIGTGDLVEFPKGMKVTWDVTEAVSKHYNLEK